MARDGEFWATSPETGRDRTDAWEQMLSATHLPWTVSVPRAADVAVFEAWVRRWWIDGRGHLADLTSTVCWVPAAPGSITCRDDSGQRPG